MSTPQRTPKASPRWSPEWQNRPMPDDPVDLRSRAEAERRNRNFPAARALYEQAAAAMRTGADPHRLAHTLRHLGLLCAEMDDLAAAETHCREALAIYEANPGAPPLDVANAVRALALVREAAGDLTEAEALWIDARRRYAELSVTEGVEGTTRRLERIAGLR